MTTPFPGARLLVACGDAVLLGDLLDRCRPLAAAETPPEGTDSAEGLRHLAREGSYDALIVDERLLAAPEELHPADSLLAGPPLLVLLEEEHPERELAWLGAGAAECVVARLPDACSLERALRRALTRHAAAAARARADATLRAVVENAIDIVSVLEADATIRYESPSVERSLGYLPSEVIGQNAFAFIHPEDQPGVLAVLEHGVKIPGYTARVEYRFRHKDGSWRVLESRARNLLHDPGIRGIIVNSRDVTDRAEAEAALRRSEARTRALLDAIPDGMVRLDREGTYLDVHVPEHYRAFTGPEQLVGRSVVELLDPELARRAIESVNAALATGMVQQFEYEIEVDGERRIREARVVRSGDDEAISIQRDVTERRKAEQEVKRLKAFLEQILNDLPADVSVMEPDGRILFLNAGSVRDPEMRAWLVGKTGLDYCRRRGLDPSLALRRQEFIDEAVATRRMVRFEETMRNAAGHERHILRMANPVVEPDGQVSRVIGYGLDITELKAKERELHESREQLRQLALHLESIREEECTRISREVHDLLGQALTALRMDVAWLERRLPETTPELEKRIESMKRLIDSTVQTTRRIAADLRPGLLDDLGLGAALEWETRQFGARTGCSCSFDDRIGHLPLPRDLSTALFRIFQEVLTNVARHAEATHVHADLLIRGDNLVLQVRDDGRGIRPEELENPRSLGLLGMRERVLPWGGRVSLEGRPDEGTTVTVTVPVAAHLETAETEALTA